MVKIGKNKISNLDASLKIFLSYMLDKKEKLADELGHEYSIEERREFVYNCAINTILEFIQEGRTYIIPRFASKALLDLFKENYLLRMFFEPDIHPQMTELTAKIISLFKCLKDPLTPQQKNDVMSNLNKLLTSTT